MSGPPPFIPGFIPNECQCIYVDDIKDIPADDRCNCVWDYELKPQNFYGGSERVCINPGRTLNNCDVKMHCGSEDSITYTGYHGKMCRDNDKYTHKFKQILIY